MDRILLLGYFGAGNFGDDALLAAWLLRHRDWLEQQNLVVDLTVNGELDPVGGFAESNELRSRLGRLIPKRSVMSTPVGDYRALIAPGGSLLQDVTSLRSLFYYLGVIRRFNLACKPVYLLCQGLGPFNTWLGRLLAPRYLRRSRLLTIRDSESYAWAQAHALLSNHPRLMLACDPMLDPPFSVPATLPSQAAMSGDYALFIPRPTGDLPYPADETTEEEALAEMCNTVSRATGLRPALLPLHPVQDSGFCRRVCALNEHARLVDIAIEGEHRNTAVLSVIAGAKMVISYRLHGLISAAAYGIVAMGVAYDPKVSAFCNEIGYPHCYPATVHSVLTAKDVSRLWQDRADVIDVVAGARSRMLERLAEAQEEFNALW